MRRRAQSPRKQGYSVIEVMMAMAVMSVGAVGILAMQQASTRGNMFAREITTATSITRTWIERARRDAVSWRARGAGGLATTTMLVAAPVTGEGTWITPTPTLAGESRGFDYFGRETAVAADMHYCVNVRYAWAGTDALRVDVRTWWHRRAGGTDTAARNENFLRECPIGQEAAVTAALDSTRVLSAVQASTVVRWTQP